MTNHREASTEAYVAGAALLGTVAVTGGIDRLITQRQRWGLSLLPLRRWYESVWALLAAIVGMWFAKLDVTGTNPDGLKTDWGVGLLMGAFGAFLVGVGAFFIFYFGHWCWEKTFIWRHRGNPRLQTPHHVVSFEEAAYMAQKYAEALPGQVAGAVGLMAFEAFTEPNIAGAAIGLTGASVVNHSVVQPYIWWKTTLQAVQNGQIVWAPDTYPEVRLGIWRFTVIGSLLFIFAEGLIAHLWGAG